MTRSAPDGILIDVRVIPRAKRSAVEGMRDGVLVVRLAAPPVDGAANEELVRVLADALDVPRRAVTIAGGRRARLKRVRVADASADALTRLLR